MTYNTKDDRQNVEGFTCLETENVEYHCPFNDHERLLNDWMRGTAFLETKTLYDESIHIKTAKVQSITLITPESFAMRKKTDELRRQQELTGDFNG